MKEKQNPLVYLFSKTWEYSAGNRKQVVQYWIGCIVANTISMILQPFLIAWLVNIVQKEGVTWSNITKLLLILTGTCVITFVFWCLHGPSRIKENNNADRSRGQYRKFLFKGFLILPLEWHADHLSGDTIDKVEKGTSALHDFASDSFIPIFFCVRLVVSFGMIAYFSPLAGIIVLVMMMLAVAAIRKFDTEIMENYTILNRSENKISARLLDIIHNITTIITLRVEKSMYETACREIDEPMPLYKRNNVLNETKWFLVSMCCAGMEAFVLGAYLLQCLVTSQVILIGTLYLLIRYLTEMDELFFRFADIYGEVIKRQSKVFNSEELAQDFKPESFANHVLPTDWQRIEIKDLDFSYTDAKGKRLHLDSVSLSFNRGERIAFVGKRGSGKTTLLQIIRDLYHPGHLRLLVDGKEIADGFAGISRAIALVPQSPEIFATTIRDNITMGVDHDEIKVMSYVNMARFSDVIDKLPKGLDSRVHEKGVKLSGGERQSLALARGLLACEDKSIILLDEPTSSVDLHNEHAIHRNISDRFKGATIISSVHKPHLLQYFDRICMFEDGRIVASGSFKELLATSPQFKELLQHYKTLQNEQE